MILIAFDPSVAQKERQGGLPGAAQSHRRRRAPHSRSINGLPAYLGKKIAALVEGFVEHNGGKAQIELEL